AARQLHFRDRNLLQQLAQLTVEGPLRARHTLDRDPRIRPHPVRTRAMLSHDLIDRDGKPLRKLRIILQPVLEHLHSYQWHLSPSVRVKRSDPATTRRARVRPAARRGRRAPPPT